MYPSHKLDLNKSFISDHTQTRHLTQLPSAQGQNTWMLSHMGHGLIVWDKFMQVVDDKKTNTEDT